MTRKKNHDLFRHILAIGNYINGTSARGGAWGYKFESIDKVNDMR